MTKYDMIHDALQEKLNKGEITMEQAQASDDIAYEKYATVEVEEKASDKNEELVDTLAELVKSGKVKLSTDDVKNIKALVDSADAGNDEGEKTDDTGAGDDGSANAEGDTAEECGDCKGGSCK